MPKTPVRMKPTTREGRKRKPFLVKQLRRKTLSAKLRAEYQAELNLISPFEVVPPEPVQDSRITIAEIEPPPAVAPAPAPEAPSPERWTKFGLDSDPGPGALDLLEEEERRRECDPDRLEEKRQSAQAAETPASTWKTDSQIAAMGKRTPILPAAPASLDLDRLPADHILWKVCRARVARLAKEDKVGKPAGFRSDYETQALRFVRESMETLLYSKAYFPEPEQRDAILSARLLLGIDNPMPAPRPLPAVNIQVARNPDALRFVPVPPFTSPIPGYRLPADPQPANPIHDAGRDLNERAWEFLRLDSWLQSVVRLDPMIDQTIVQSIVAELLNRGSASGEFLTRLYNTLREKNEKFHHLPERGFGWNSARSPSQ